MCVCLCVCVCVSPPAHEKVLPSACAKSLLPLDQHPSHQRKWPINTFVISDVRWCHLYFLWWCKNFRHGCNLSVSTWIPCTKEDTLEHHLQSLTVFALPLSVLDKILGKRAVALQQAFARLWPWFPVVLCFIVAEAIQEYLQQTMHFLSIKHVCNIKAESHH